VKTKKTPAPQRAGTEDREARALAVARRALNELSDDPAAVRLFIGMVPLLGGRMLRKF
jgi:hypothetical protein